MPHRVSISPDARDRLDAIYDFIARAASPDTATRFVSGILDRLAVLGDYPPGSVRLATI